MSSPCAHHPASAQAAGLSPAAVAILVANHARFLGFLERRVGNRDAAEEILQEAFVRGLSRGDAGRLREDESAVAWFYRLLRNALVDRARRASAERRGLARLATLGDAPPAPEPERDPELVAVICACIGSLIETLEPAHQRALREVELGSTSVRDFAAREGITPGHAAVRLFRARQALRRRAEQSCGTCAAHGCYECECRGEPHPGHPAAAR
ncbi:MAG TPA: RNA polymerase sigma factor [Polyangia bacterium]|nr:RNA polymerase sigma factor [Polyangia bacterium]